LEGTDLPDARILQLNLYDENLIRRKASRVRRGGIHGGYWRERNL
jgi:hypothetical protein